MITDKRKIKQTLYYVNVLEKNSFFFTKLEIEKKTNFKLDLSLALNI